MPTDAETERAREEAEEEEYAAETIATLPDVTLPILRKVTANATRDWVRAYLVSPAIERMYLIGMGRTKFAVPTMAGNTVSVPAPASVQQRALAAVIAIGVPSQIGLDADAGLLPGVLAFGDGPEMEAARVEAHGVRYLPRTGGIEVEEGEVPDSAAYEPPAGHEIVEVIEGETAGLRDARGEVADKVKPPAPPPRPLDVKEKAAAILARRRAKSAKTNGNGSHP